MMVRYVCVCLRVYEHCQLLTHKTHTHSPYGSFEFKRKSVCCCWADRVILAQLSTYRHIRHGRVHDNGFLYGMSESLMDQKIVAPEKSCSRRVIAKSYNK